MRMALVMALGISFSFIYFWISCHPKGFRDDRKVSVMIAEKSYGKAANVFRNFILAPVGAKNSVILFEINA